MKLEDFFINNSKVAIAFSGGVDSAYLLYMAKNSGAKVKAYYVASEFQPEFEKNDAMRLASELDVDIQVLCLEVLSNSNICTNPHDRCYFCKKQIFSAIVEAASKDGFDIILDGSNASDNADDRPGMRVLKEMSIRSPLRECGLTKTQIRKLSKEAKLFTWNKAAYACLATRIPTGEKITIEKLKITELAENYLFSLGFTDFRIRSQNGHARLQVPKNQISEVLSHRIDILEKLKLYYKSVSLDLEAR